MSDDALRRERDTLVATVERQRDLIAHQARELESLRAIAAEAERWLAVWQETEGDTPEIQAAGFRLATAILTARERRP